MNYHFINRMSSTNYVLVNILDLSVVILIGPI